MAQLILDTSVVLKWYLADEEDHEAALRLRDGIIDGDHAAVVPSHLTLELASGLLAAVRRGRLSDDAIFPALRAFKRFELPVLDAASLISRAATLAPWIGLSIYDALFVAAAEATGSTLVTADRALRERAAAVGSVQMLGELP